MVDASRDPNPLQWHSLYYESDLYKSAIRVYTKPLFRWRKALGRSTDGKTLYDFAERGLKNLDAIHRALRSERFQFRPSTALSYNFNGKHRTLYIPPWEERIVDLLLYRILNRRLQHWFSSNSYAYRERGLGLDQCQMRIATFLRAANAPVYVVKRDIKDFFASIDHGRLLSTLETLVAPEDYLFHLLRQRIQFAGCPTHRGVRCVGTICVLERN
jgi:retron-type reverse transcriptase